MKKSIPVSIILSSILVFSCGSDDFLNAGDLNINADAATLVNLVNSHRVAGATCGNTAKEAAGQLIWDDVLAKAALDHSNDMQLNDYFSHTGLDGSTFSERTISAGFDGSPLGENIANGYSSEEAVVQAWMESAGHCLNIMNGNATHIGVAKSNNGNYWTMILGRKN